MNHHTNGYHPQRWSLQELFPALDSHEIEQAIQDMETHVAHFEGFRPELTAELSAAQFQQALAAYEGIVRRLNRLYAFAHLSFAEDTQSQAAQTYLGRIRQLAAETFNRVLFFDLWWKHLDDATATRLLATAGDYHYWLEALRREKPYTLTEAEERIVNLKNVNGRQALDQLYDAITNRYVFRLTLDGQEQELTQEQLTIHFRSSDPALRQAAYQELFRVYGQDAPILGQIYQFIVRDWGSEFVQLRHYASPLAVRNVANDVPDAVVDTLLTVAQANADLFQRYFELKARWIGMERLRRYDIYAPVAEAEKSYAFDEAVQLVLESLRQFDPELERLARRVFDEQHYDGEVRRGKMGGAFCLTVNPDLTPWVLHSYVGKARDIATMAHELGHALHSMLAEHHTALTQQSSLPLAETASTFSEILLVDKLLALETDPAIRRDLLFRQMDDAYATIMRQVYFALFERQAHEQTRAGASVDDLCELYLKLCREQFGDAVDVPDVFKYEWVYIPHIYGAPFYVYAYAFGQLLVLALYQQYKQEGESFKPRYLEILAAGGAEAPVEVLRRAGIDVYAASFWQGGFDVLRQLLEALESLPMPA